MITGYETGVPMRCVWCWETTTAIGVDEWTGTTAPLHVTCSMQMLVVRRKGPRRGTVAARRYYRLMRHHRKLAKARLRSVRLITSG